MESLISAIKDLQSRLKDIHLTSEERKDLQSRLNALKVHLMVLE